MAEEPDRLPSPVRNVSLLVVCQALCNTVTTVMLATSALAGYHLAANKGLATLPHAVQWVGTMAMAIPAALLMRHWGRRRAFLFGTLFGMVGGLIATWGLFIGQFWVFVGAMVSVGFFNAFSQNLRFAAAEAAPLEWRSRAISFVVGGGLIAAFVGPEIAKLTKDVYADYVFAGTYVTVAVIPLMLVAVLVFVQFPASTLHRRAGTGRPIGRIAAQPAYIVAVLSSVIGWGTMVFLMSATPIAMIVNGHHFTDAAFVVQWHVFGMFAPSFFTGWLISRFGVLNIMISGLVLAVAAVCFGLSGTSLSQFWLTNVCIGIGWNFLFVSGTTLLTETYEPEEKAKAQGVNDFLVFGSVAMFSFSAGLIQANFGWDAVNMFIVPWIVAVGLAVLWLKRLRRLQPVAARAGSV